MLELSYKDAVNKIQEEYVYIYPEKAAVHAETQTPNNVLKLLLNIPEDKVKTFAASLSNDLVSSIFQHVKESQISQIIKLFSPEQINNLLNVTDKIHSELISSKLSKKTKREIAEIRKYPAGTAGTVMDTNVINFVPSMTVKEAVSKIKARKKRGIRSIFISNEKNELDSMASIQTLLLSENNKLLKDISKPIPTFVTELTPNEEIIEKLEEYNLTDIPVVNINNKFVGVVQHNSLIKMAKQEMSKDILTMVGVSEDERALSKINFAVRKRLPWLEINLLTAFLAASVVALFETTISKYTALAVLLPVVAGQSGNTGAQALAVTMRGLALKEIRTSHWLKLIIKELGISTATGSIVALTTSLGVYFWSKSIGLTFIIGISMIISMVLASISGAAVPIVLARLNQDPAASSSIILTTVTDVTGFFSFLGIATLLSQLI